MYKKISKLFDYCGCKCSFSGMRSEIGLWIVCGFFVGFWWVVCEKLCVGSVDCVYVMLLKF